MPVFQNKRKDSRGEYVAVEVSDRNAEILRASGRYKELSGKEAESVDVARRSDAPPAGAEVVEPENGPVTEVPASEGDKSAKGKK